MNSARNFLADLFEASDRATETNVERCRFEFLLQLRDWDRIGDNHDALRFRTRLIPTPAPPAAADREDKEQEENYGDGAMGTRPETRSFQPRRGRPAELAEQERKET